MNLERYLEEKNKQREELALKDEHNLANYQFVDAINGLISRNYNENCKGFSLKDKAHIRKLIDQTKQQAEGEKKKMASLNAALGKLKEQVRVKESAAQTNQRLRQDIECLHDAEVQADQEMDEVLNQKRGLEERFVQAKKQLERQRSKKDTRETKLGENCSQSLSLLKNSRDALAKEVERLELQSQTNNIQKSLDRAISEQGSRGELLMLEQQLKAFDIRLEALKFNSKSFIKQKEREYDEIREQWSQLMAERERRLQELEEQKKGEGEKRKAILNLRSELKMVGHRAKLSEFEMECQQRNRRYGLSSSGKKTDRTGIEEPEEEQAELDKQIGLVVAEAKDKLRQMEEVVRLVAAVAPGGTQCKGSRPSRESLESTRHMANTMLSNIL